MGSYDTILDSFFNQSFMKKFVGLLMAVTVVLAFSGCNLFKSDKGVEPTVSDARAEEELAEEAKEDE